METFFLIVGILTLYIIGGLFWMGAWLQVMGEEETNKIACMIFWPVILLFFLIFVVIWPFGMLFYTYKNDLHNLLKDNLIIKLGMWLGKQVDKLDDIITNKMWGG